MEVPLDITQCVLNYKGTRVLSPLPLPIFYSHFILKFIYLLGKEES